MNGNVPVMPQHRLTLTKDTKVFKSGETVTCFIAAYAEKRYAVWEVTHSKTPPRYEVFTKAEMDIAFHEIA
jgi:hypothetical protein